MVSTKKTAKKKPAPASKTIADIAHPGQSAPSDTSKPIITHRPIMQDPMVVDTNSDADIPLEIPLTKKGETKIQPIANEEVSTSKEPDEPKQTETTVDDPKDERTGEEDDEVIGEQPEVKDKKTNVPDEAETQATQDIRVEQLVDSKKYFLPINAVEQRRSKRFVALGIFVALLLAVAWADVALDAGLVKIDSVKPITHFFSN